MEKNAKCDGEFAQLFDDIETALRELKKMFCYFPDSKHDCTKGCQAKGEGDNECEEHSMTKCRRNSWLNRVHNMNPYFVLTADPFMWLTFWAKTKYNEIDYLSAKNIPWSLYILQKSDGIKTYCGVSIKINDGKLKTELNNFKLKPLTGRLSNQMLGKIVYNDIDRGVIDFSNWFLYNQFYSGNDGELIPLPKDDADSFYKPLLILWKLFFSCFNNHNEKVSDLLKGIEDIELNDPNAKLYEANTADKLITMFSVNADKKSCKELCIEISTVFWELVKTALKTTIEEPKPSLCFYSIQGETTNMQQISKHDSVTIFNQNPVYQKCQSALWDDYLRINNHEGPIISDVCTDGELLSTLIFFNSLSELVDTEGFRVFFADVFALLMNHPYVQTLVFKNKQLLPNLERMYERYSYSVYLRVKFDTSSLCKTDYLSAVPLIRYNYTDAVVVEEFVTKNVPVDFRLHKWGDCYGKFRLRYATESDIQRIISIQEDGTEEDKNVYMRAKENEITVAIRLNQLVCLEELCNDTTFSGEHLKNIYPANTIVAFALVCPTIFPYSKNALKDQETANYNEKIIEKLKELGKNIETSSSFNTAFVCADYHGFGIQRMFLLLLEKLALQAGSKGIYCTVSPSNDISYRNFLAGGYSKIDRVTYDIDGEEYLRDFLELRLL